MTPKAQLETELVSRLKPLLEAAELSVLTEDNPDLVGPLGMAIRTLGGTQETLGVVSQHDLDSIPDSKLDALLMLAELAALESIEATVTDSHYRSQDLEVFSDGRQTVIATRIARLKERLALIGIGVAQGVGSFRVNWGISARRCGSENTR